LASIHILMLYRTSTIAQKARDVFVIQRKTTMQAARALGYSSVKNEGKVFEKIFEILGLLLLDGAVLGSVKIEVTLKRNGASVAHIDMRSEADGTSKITSALVDEHFYPTIRSRLAELKPDHQEVSNFSNVTSGLWDLD
jgi:hypothetical protein